MKDMTITPIGEYKISYEDLNGKLLSESEWVRNKIVNDYSFIMAQMFLKTPMENTPVMAIGIGTTPVTANDSKLSNEIFRVSSTVVKATFVDGIGMIKKGDNINAVEITGRFGTNVPSITIKEVGLFWGDTSQVNTPGTGLLYSRRVMDSGWEKPSDIIATITYRIIFKVS